MGLARYLHAAVDVLLDLPLMRQARAARYRRLFARNRGGNMFFGVFDTVEAAEAAAPPTFPLGYDNPASAGLYLDRLAVLPNDYPAMFWLARSFAVGMTRVTDLGGSVGIKYFAFSGAIDYPPELKWKVVDVPAVAACGRDFARSRHGGERLDFAHDLNGDGADVLFVSGAHQYLREPLHHILSARPHRYRRVILNTAAVHPRRSYYTLNGIGTAFCVYQVCAEPELVSGFARLGYALRDRWKNLGKRLVIPFSEGCDLDHYSGFCFDRAE
jgi:putative methyltransferase (TIGR04325 family)